MPNLDNLKKSLGIDQPGLELHALIERLYPICRSITGDGVRETLAILSEGVRMTVHEVPSGTKVLDWTVPKEWNIRDAYVKDASGRRVIDFQASNLHVVGYSVPVEAKMTLAQLSPRLHSLPNRPAWIPYRNSFYTEDWGFCLSDDDLQALPDGDYEVRIDSTLADGNLTYGEVVIPGKEAEEVLVICHVCHPSLCNDNLSGNAVSSFLCRMLAETVPRYTYRFLFLPVTIGGITWLALNEHRVSNVRAGLVLTLLGDTGSVTYKKSRRSDTIVDRAALHVLKHTAPGHQIQEFSPYGYDERQFCSPGFNLPVGCLMRTPHGCFPEYHTSGDNLDFVKAECLEDSLEKCLAILDIIDRDEAYVSLNPKGEPQLGRRGIFRALQDREDDGANEMALLWVLNFSDGEHSLLDIAERANLPFAKICAAADILRDNGLLESSRPG